MISADFRRLALITSQWAAVLGVVVLAGCGGGSSSSPRKSTILTFSSGGVMPQGIGIDANGNAWVANEGSNDVAEISPTGAVLNEIQVGTAPHGLRINRATGEPTSGQIWVENTASANVSVIDSDELINTFPTGTGDTQPQHAVFDSAGNAWVTNQGIGSVVQISPDGTILQSADVGGMPHALAEDQSDNLWVANYGTGDVTQVIGSTGEIGQVVSVGQKLTGNAIDASGNLWQSVSATDMAAKLSITSFTLTYYPVGNTPRGITIDSNGGQIFVANQGSNNVLELNSSGLVIDDFPVGAQPENMAIDQQGNVWVTNAVDNTVSVLLKVALPDPNTDDASDG